MASLNPRSLVSKLNATCRRALEAAAGLCLARTHYDIEVEHFLLKLLDSSNNDAAAILRELIQSKQFVDFLTLPAYDKLNATEKASAGQKS